MILGLQFSLAGRCRGYTVNVDMAYTVQCYLNECIESASAPYGNCCGFELLISPCSCDFITAGHKHLISCVTHEQELAPYPQTSVFTARNHFFFRRNLAVGSRARCSRLSSSRFIYMHAHVQTQLSGVPTTTTVPLRLVCWRACLRWGMICVQSIPMPKRWRQPTFCRFPNMQEQVFFFSANPGVGGWRLHRGYMIVESLSRQSRSVRNYPFGFG